MADVAAAWDEHQACRVMAARSGSSSAMALAPALSCSGELGLFGGRLSRLP
jgi:hypothetical protein